MKKQLLFLLVILLAFGAQAQTKKVALHHAGTTTLFTGNNGYALAVTAAVSGDTIYLPGGYWDATSIDKRLTIFGAGHFPDSTAATGASILTGGFYFYPGADSTLFQGIQVNGDINFTGGLVTYITLNRCHFNRSIHYSNTDHITYAENMIDYDIVGQNIADFMVVRNNLFTGNPYNAPISSIVQGALIENNIFNDALCGWCGHATLEAVHASMIRNNIFLRTNGGFINGSNNVFQNNGFPNIPSLGNNTVIGNYENLVPANLFVNYTSGLNTYNYNDNLHLQTPAAYPGTDNTQIGLYGGAKPFKMASVPANPHIRTKAIAPNTDASGNLNVNISVGAQDQ